MKLPGNFFRKPMKENQIIAANGKLQCHSYDGSGFGILRQWPLVDDIASESESLKFTLSKEEYQLLNMFDSIDMTRKGNTIVCKQNKSKFQLQDMVEASPYQPSIHDIKPIESSLNSMVIASGFVGTKDNCKGVILGPRGIYGTDSGSLYYKKGSLSVEKPIMIPVEGLKMLDKNATYTLMVNEKHMVYNTAGEMIYTPIYTFCVDVERLKKGNTYPVKTNISLLKSELRRASNFGEEVDVIIDKGQLIIKASNPINGTTSYETSLDCETKITEMCLHFNVKRLIKTLNAFDSEELSFGGTLMVFGDDDEFVMTICMSAPNHKKAVV